MSSIHFLFHKKRIGTFRSQSSFVRDQGFEPWTHWLRVNCSTNWANRASFFQKRCKGTVFTSMLQMKMDFFQKNIALAMTCDKGNNIRCWESVLVFVFVIDGLRYQLNVVKAVLRILLVQQLFEPQVIVHVGQHVFCGNYASALMVLLHFQQDFWRIRDILPVTLRL